MDKEGNLPVLILRIQFFLDLKLINTQRLITRAEINVPHLSNAFTPKIVTAIGNVFIYKLQTANVFLLFI